MFHLKFPVRSYRDSRKRQTSYAGSPFNPWPKLGGGVETVAMHPPEMLTLERAMVLSSKMLRWRIDMIFCNLRSDFVRRNILK